MAWRPSIDSASRAPAGRYNRSARPWPAASLWGYMSFRNLALHRCRSHPSTVLRRALPFRGRDLTCGTGIHLKMAITRWSNWATDAGMRDLTSSGCASYRPQTLNYSLAAIPTY